MKTHRNRPLNRPVPFDAPAVRFAAFSLEPGDRRGTRIFSGVGIEQEARALYAASVREAAPNGRRVILERHTIESITATDFGSNITYAPEPEPVPAVEPVSPLSDPIGAILSLFMLPRASKAGKQYATGGEISPGIIGNKAGMILTDEIGSLAGEEPPEAFMPEDLAGHGLINSARSLAASIEGDGSPTPREILTCLLSIASHHQGAHGTTGAKIAETLKIPHPITMLGLAGFALGASLNPREVWPWWGKAPATCADYDAAVLEATRTDHD